MKNWTLYLVLTLSAPLLAVASETLTLESAVSQALSEDPWLEASRFQQKALEENAVAAGQLPDPKLNVALANLPLDSFSFTQEPMTQFKLGVSQMFPPGDTLELKAEKLQTLAEAQPAMRDNRKGRAELMVVRLWLDIWLARESAAVLEAKRVHFQQLADVVTSTYSTTAGRTRQQDVIRAQLELSRLDDRLEMLRQQEDAARGRLSEWIGQQAWLPLPRQLPGLKPLRDYNQDETEALQALWLQHPSVLALDRRIEAADRDVDLARQKYKPGWGVNASYGYRGEDALGRDRADFVSVGVTVDLPLFTRNRQDRKVQAAVASTDALEQQRLLLLRNLRSDWEKARENLQSLDERVARYRNEILPQMADQAEAALTAYTNDDGDFAEVMRARIAELNASIELLRLQVARLKNIAQLNYTLLAAAGKGE